jgi:hypothetical protein
MALFGFSSMIMADESNAELAKEKWQEKKEEMQQKFEDKKHFWQGKKDDLTFEEDHGVGNGHQEGKPGSRVGHSDDMPGKRLGHRKGRTGSDESGPDGNFEPNRNPEFRNRANQGENFMPRRRRMFDKDNNPPGMRGGEGTNWENLPGRRGGPGTSPDRSRRFGNQQGDNANNNQPNRFGKKFRCKKGRRKFDNDNNPPGMRGGEGTNWENLPGRKGGPGTSPDVSRKEFFKGSSENNGNNGSNGLHIGNRKNGVGKGIKNYTGRTKANQGKKSN